MAELRAAALAREGRPVSRAAAVEIALLWLGGAIALAVLLWPRVTRA